MEALKEESEGPYNLEAPPLADGYHDPFAVLHKVVKQNYRLPDYDPSSLANNLMVMQILNLAKISARKGQTINWKDYYN